MKTFALRALAHLTVCLAATSAGAAWAADAVNLYTTREPALIQPLLDAFTKAHNGAIQVNTVFIKDGCWSASRPRVPAPPPMCS